MKVYAVALSMLCLVACNKGNIDTKEAVRQGVIDHLASRQNLNVGSMKVEVSSVTFKENEADATVAVVAKGQGGGQPMTLHYTLERKGNRWVVKPKAGQNPHGSMPDAQTTPGPGTPGGAIPPGHPPVPKQ